MEEDQPLNVKANMGWTVALKAIYAKLYKKLKTSAL